MSSDKIRFIPEDPEVLRLRLVRRLSDAQSDTETYLESLRFHEEFELDGEVHDLLVQLEVLKLKFAKLRR